MALIANNARHDVAGDTPAHDAANLDVNDSQRGGDAGRMLNGCRQYLLMNANELIGPELQAQLGASDLVQDTFVEAQRHLGVFRGKTDVEMRAWLRKILECRLANIRRAYLQTEKRAVGREVTVPNRFSAEVLIASDSVR